MAKPGLKAWNVDHVSKAGLVHVCHVSKVKLVHVCHVSKVKLVHVGHVSKVKLVRALASNTKRHHMNLQSGHERITNTALHRLIDISESHANIIWLALLLGSSFTLSS